MKNDLLLNANSGNCSVLVLLDLSAALDKVEHDTLIEHLEHCVGIQGMFYIGLTHSKWNYDIFMSFM